MADDTTSTTTRPLLDRLLVRSVVIALVLANVGGVGALLAVGTRYPSLVSPGLLALGFGLRHGVDCDHIAAIDNVARKLSDDGASAALVGLWFSLGHSTVVVALCLLVAGGSSYARDHVDSLADVGGAVGGAVSAATLIVIGAVNLAGVGPLLRAAWRARKREADRADDGGKHADDHGVPGHTHAVEVVDGPGGPRLEGLGVLARCRCCKAIFARIDAAWKMYPVGLLFGLGFDTASEVGLLALAAVGREGVPPALVLVLPLLFTAGMALVDTCDGLLVLLTFAKAGDGEDRAGALLFGLLLTAASASVSLAVGTIVGLGLAAPALPPALRGPVAAVGEGLDANTTLCGLLVVGLFVVALVVAVVAPGRRRRAPEAATYASIV